MSKVICITGVSSGFGKVSAELLAEKGFRVYGISRRITGDQQKYIEIQGDVCDRDQVVGAIDQILEKEGRLDVLINNAGMGIGGSVEEASEEEIRLQMDTNFHGAVNMIRAVLPAMRQQGGGLIINTSSIGGLMGLPFQAYYSASKFALEGLSEALSMEVKEFGIKVVLVEPGDFSTQFTANRKIITRAYSGSSYEAQFDRTLAIIEKDERGGLHPSRLAQKILRIVQQKHPRSRYVVSTFEQKLAVLLKNLLPASWFSAILRSHYGIK